MYKIISAFCKNRGIGNAGKLPWNIKKDMAYFKNTTSFISNKKKMNAVICGRNTWHSITLTFLVYKGVKNKYNKSDQRFRNIVSNGFIET